MTETVVVGIDLGSGGARAVAVDADGTVRAWTYERFPEASSWPTGRADPGAWLDGLGRAIAAVEVPGARVAAIAVGGQSPTTVPMSGELAVTCRHPAGNGLSLRGQHLAQRAYLEDELGRSIVPAQIWDWALRRLGAGEIQGLWPDEEVLPGYGEPVMIGTVIGECDGRVGAPAGTPLVSASNDAYMSFWAGGLGVPGRGHDPGGRTGGIGVAVAAEDRPESLFGFSSAVAGVDVVGGPVNGHGELLDWWAGLCGRTIPEVLELAATAPPGSDGVVVLPYHDGERAPRWDSRLRGEIHDLRFRTGPAEVSRAVLEAAAYGLRHIHESLQAEGVSMELMVCAGSPARSQLWNSIKASVLEVPVDVPERPEQLSAYGCALAAGAAVGWWEGVGAPSMSSWPKLPMTRMEPEPSDAYHDGYARFLQAGDAAVARLSELDDR